MNEAPHDRARLAPEAWDALAETLAAYALGALPEAEAQGVARHLVACAACRTEARALQAVAGLLAVACPPAEPSPTLREAVLAAVAAAPAGPAPPPVWRLAPAPEEAAPAGRRGGAWWRPWLLTAAAALLAVAVGISNVLLRQELRAREAALAIYEAAARSWALEGEAAAQGARAMLIEPAGGGRPMLVVQVLPAPPAGRAYQVWVIRGGQPVSAGLLHRLDAPPMLMELPEALAGAEGVAISVEPASGSPRPTGPIVLGARL
jgi:anti-sigma-K factor RskA